MFKTHITIDLMSTRDTYLFLLDDHGKYGEVRVSNDDGGCELNSRLRGSLVAGDYTIEATTYWGSISSGTFDLEIRSFLFVGGNANEGSFCS